MRDWSPRYPKYDIPPEVLIYLYVDKQLTLQETASKLGLSTSHTYRFLNRYNIPVRSHAESRKGKRYSPKTEFKNGMIPHNSLVETLTKERLSELYYLREMTVPQIAREIGSSRGSIFAWMKKYNLKRRSQSTTMKMVLQNGRRSTNAKPNKAERRLVQIIQDHNLPYKYVGNGVVWFEGYNPDFINVDGHKGVIELFGDYWHTAGARTIRAWEGDRAYHFAKYGFRTLVIWEGELKDESKVASKIKRFTRQLS